MREKKAKRLFGTNGVRGVVGREMTPLLAMRIGAALGRMRKGRIVVGRDTRTSGEALGAALKAGLLAGGCTVLDAGILPTPALQYIVKGRHSAGAVITASHNPPEYNGVKVIEPDGTEMGDEETLVLEELVLDHPMEVVPWPEMGRAYRAPYLVEEYVEGVLSHFSQGVGEGMTVVVDPGSGAGAHCTPEILRRLGCRVLTVNGQMDGRFPGRQPEPSAEGLRPLADMVRANDASFGVAHDGDADRAVFVDEKGNYVEENCEFALILQMICRDRRGIVVTPVSTSLVVEDVARKNGSEVKYTPVGSIYVARSMISLIGTGSKVIMGGEGNGGLIYPEHQFCRDGAMTAAMMVQLLASGESELSSLVGELPVYHMRKGKIPTRKGERIVQSLAAAYSEEQILTVDGVKLIRGRSWALVRPSGTEPLVRVTVESETEEGADSLFREIMQAVDRIQGSP